MNAWASTRCATSFRSAVLAVLSVSATVVQAQAGVAVPTESSTTDTMPAPHGVMLDQVVAVVNGDLVLESDIDEERRMTAFQPFQDKTKPFTRATAIDRLVDRALILQQSKLQPEQAITDAEVNAQLGTLRKDIPACKEYHCETDAGWQKFIADQGLTLPELITRWRERMRVLRYIEQRFKMGIRISAADIQNYYDKTLLPEYAKQKVKPPKLETISDRIQEILLQQQVGSLLDDWLQSLKAQGSVRMSRANTGGRL